MIFEELLREEKQEGRLEARRETLLDFLGEFGDIPAELQDRIEKLEDAGKLKILIKIAARADSIADFEKDAEPYFISEN